MSEFSPTAILEPKLAERFEAIATKLGTKKQQYVYHERSDAEDLYAQLKTRSSMLTYGQIVQRYETDESPDLPGEAVRCSDPEVEYTLMEGHLDDIDHPHFKYNPIKLAGFKVSQLQQVAQEFGLDFTRAFTPTVEGYEWFRAYVVKTTRNSAAILLRPWMQTEKEQGSPFPIIYTIGSPKLSDIRNIAACYMKREGQSEPDESLAKVVIYSLAKGIWNHFTDKKPNGTLGS